MLVLGGTGFLSGAVVDAALDRGHAVSALTRGRRGAPREGALHVVGDRDDVASLRAAVDRAVAVHGPPDAVLAEYGPMKAESERVLAAASDGALLVRAGLIVGPGDRTRRMTTWLDRVARHDRLVVPGTLDQAMAFVDVRDLAGWMVRGGEAGWSGPVTATGPRDMTTLGEVLETARRVVADDGVRPAELVVVPEADLLAAGVAPWTDLPFWLPADTAATAWDVDTTRARELGLPSRPLGVTLADTWAWLRRPAPEGGAGLEHPPLPEALDPARWA